MVSIPKRVREIIGLTRTVFRQTVSYTDRTPTISIGRNDYAFWDKTRRGKTRGLEISGVFIKPVCDKITEWTFDSSPSIDSKNDKTNEKIQEWMNDNYSEIQQAYRESLSLGDSYLLVNPDGTIIALSPDTVTPMVDPKDYSKIIGWRVRNVYEDPENPGSTMVITEEFTEKRRRRIVQRKDARTKRTRVTAPTVTPRPQTFPNLIGKIPIIHIPNMNSTSEMFGRPELESALYILYMYDEVMTAAIHGNKKQGRPTPVIYGLGTPGEVDQFWEKYAKRRSRVLSDGTTEVEEYLEFDSDKFITLGGTANFKWESPGSFSQDTQNILELLFYLLVQHTEIPEYALGTSINSTEASAKTQVDPLVKLIEFKRRRVEVWLKQLIDVAMAYIALSETSLKIPERYTIRWPNLTREEGVLVLKAVQWAYSQGMLDDVEALSLSPIDVVNPEKSVKRARTDFNNRVGKTNTKSGSFEGSNESDPELDDDLEKEEQGGS